MARKRPPQYSVDGPAIFIADDDDCWDKERIELELADYRDRDEPEENHPYNRYRAGKSRFRLDEVIEYIDEAKKPEKWHLRPLPAEVQATVTALHVSAGSRARQYGDDDAKAQEAVFLAAHRALVHGIAKVENGPSGTKAFRKGLTEADLSEMDEGIRLALGSAVLQAFRALDDDEGKL